MLTITIKTDQPEAELCLYEADKLVGQLIWQAHRQLAETIHTQLEALLKTGQKEFSDITGVIFFKGPGSFTGLRIGAAVANALASSLNVPIVGGMALAWISDGLEALDAGKNDKVVVPEYGAPARTTMQKK